MLKENDITKSKTLTKLILIFIIIQKTFLLFHEELNSWKKIKNLNNSIKKKKKNHKEGR